MRIKHKTIIRPVAPSTTRPTQPPTPAPPTQPAAPRVLSAFRWPEPHEHHRDSDSERTFAARWDNGEIGWDDHDQVTVY